jgi:hypothetical protein
MSDNLIKISDLIDVNFLSTRSLANSIFEKVNSRTENEVTIDFKGIIGTTRSFMDQVRANLTKTNKKVNLINLSNDLLKMQEAVVV